MILKNKNLFSVDKNRLIGTYRGDFYDSKNKIAVKYFSNDETIFEDKTFVKELQDAANYFAFEKFDTYEKLLDACEEFGFSSTKEADFFTCTPRADIWVRLLPSRDSYNMYIKFYHPEKSNFMFTFGNNNYMPYKGGWVIVKAENRLTAIQKFRSVFPDRTEGLGNYAFCYDAEEFSQTELSYNGNLGHKTQDIIWEDKPLYEKKNFTDSNGSLNTIIDHKIQHIPNENNLIHSVIVKCNMQPIWRDIAIEVGYHPFGYNSKELSVTKLKDRANSWVVIFSSWNYCD